MISTLFSIPLEEPCLLFIRAMMSFIYLISLSSSFFTRNEDGTGTEKEREGKRNDDEKTGPVSRRVENHVEHVNRNDILDMCPLRMHLAYISLSFIHATQYINPLSSSLFRQTNRQTDKGTYYNRSRLDGGMRRNRHGASRPSCRDRAGHRSSGFYF